MRAAVAALLLALCTPAQADGVWNHYPLLMWQDRTPAQLRALPGLGFTGAKVRATGGQVDEEGLRDREAAGLSIYLENIATDFYSAYHRWQPDRPVTALFDAAKAAYRAQDPAAFQRTPSLSDPDWLRTVQDRLAALVRSHGQHRPLFYNLADEAGIADVAAAWDFDRSPAALAQFRTWLQAHYPNLAALNAQWGTAFPAWGAVVPQTTDQAIAGPGDNFSAWADFKAWMDVAFAGAVRAGADALHRADPAARAALEGAQVPGWGGYDYALLAPALDVMEIYDIGGSLDLALGFNPALIALRTSFGTGPAEAHAAWRHLLHGGRGTIVWDEANDVAAPDGQPGPRGLALSRLMQAMRAVAPVLAAASPAEDKVAVLASQASFRLQWLLDRRAGDHDWAARDAEREYDDNAWRASRRVLLQKLAALGVAPHWVADGGLDSLSAQGVRVLLLPHAIALSDRDVAAIRAFQQAGGTVLADTEPGLWDGHLRRRPAPPLPGVPHPEPLRPLGAPPGPDVLEGLAGLLQQAGSPPRARFLGPDGARATGIDVRWRQDAEGLILSLQAAQPFAGPSGVTLVLDGMATVTDLRRPGQALSRPWRIPLDPVEPSVLRVTMRP